MAMTAAVGPMFTGAEDKDPSAVLRVMGHQFLTDAAVESPKNVPMYLSQTVQS